MVEGEIGQQDQKGAEKKGAQDPPPCRQQFHQKPDSQGDSDGVSGALGRQGKTGGHRHEGGIPQAAARAPCEQAFGRAEQKERHDQIVLGAAALRIQSASWPR
jgi:hypothetical protein